MDQLMPGHAFYTISTAVPVHVSLDMDRLQRAVSALVERHESLRTTFGSKDGIPVQQVHESLPVRVRKVDLLPSAPEIRESMAIRVAAQEAGTPFDLSNGPLIRICVVRLAANRHLLIVTMHHIVSDAWSLGVLFRDLVELLAADATGRPPALPELSVQCADVAVWQAERLGHRDDEKNLTYWRDSLAGASPLELPTDRPRPTAASFSGAAIRFALQRSVVERCRNLAQAEQATPFMALLAAWFGVLAVHADQEDLVVGVPVAGRDRSELEPLIGFFVNMLPIRCQLDRSRSFRELLGDVRAALLAGMEHQDTPFEQIVEVLGQSGDLRRHPVFQTSFQLHQPSDATISDFAVLPEVTRTTSNFDLNLELWPEEGGLAGRLTYATDLFDSATAEQLIRHYQHLLAAVIAAPDTPLRLIDLADPSERQRIREFEVGVGTYRYEATVVSLFAEAAQNRPDAVAVIDGELKLTYAELNHRTDQLAAALIQHGVRPEEHVGVLAERNVATVIALLGVLKAGAAYVGLPPDDPPARTLAMLDLAAVRFIVSAKKMPGLDISRFKWVPVDARAGATLLPSFGPGRVAYVSFTSGSTGRPKGVQVTHRGVVRLVTGTSFHQFGPGQTYLMFSPVAFDASTLEIWGALCTGSTLVVGPPGTPSLSELAMAVVRGRITTLWLTAGLFHQMVEAELGSLTGVDTIMTGGDVVSATHVRRLLASPGLRRVINGYGPTENTTFTCCHLMTSADEVSDPVPIGRPVTGTSVRILDGGGRAVPLGVPGELWTAGAGVARGYLGNQETEAAAFLAVSTPEGRNLVYRTGDLARWLPDGNIQFLGRADRQVKVRGFRVEPAEIEAVLAAWPNVSQAAVTLTGIGTDVASIIAFVVPREGSLDLEAVRTHVRMTLPAYLQPTSIHGLTSLPLNGNGKVDHAALQAVVGRRSLSRPDRVEPRTLTEEAVARVWAEVLGHDGIGVTDDFFTDLGGHSLLGTRLIARIRSDFGVDLPLKTLFDTPHIAGIADAVDALLIALITAQDSSSSKEGGPNDSR